jgi:hypothetical protein
MNPQRWLLFLSVLALSASAMTFLWMQFARRGSKRNVLVSLALLALAIAAAGAAMASNQN